MREVGRERECVCVYVCVGGCTTATPCRPPARTHAPLPFLLLVREREGERESTEHRHALHM